MQRKFAVLVTLITVFLLTLSSSAFAASWYAGVQKSGSSYIGIAAQIQTPTSLPNLGDSGESGWVTNAEYNSNGAVGQWVQTGISYYDGYSGFKT